MIRGWYTGASGMNAQQARLDAISNNLANVDTTGYKKDVAVSKSFSELLLRRMNDDGVITGIATHDELLLSNEEYKEIYTSQMASKEV